VLGEVAMSRTARRLDVAEKEHTMFKKTPKIHKMDFQNLLDTVAHKLSAADSFFEVYPRLQDDVQRLLRAERVTVYQRNPVRQRIFTQIESGGRVQEIELAMDVRSIAGFTAMSKRSFCVMDVQNPGSLRSIHPDLAYDSRYDKESGFVTRSVIVVPIMWDEGLVGVLQVINRRGGDTSAPAICRRPWCWRTCSRSSSTTSSAALPNPSATSCRRAAYARRR